LIAHRFAAGGLLLDVVLPATLLASLFVVVSFLDGGIANMNGFVIGREGVRLRTEAEKRFSK
jgi:hypothetical protein